MDKPFNVIRTKVSMKKRRYISGKFNLDLSYITDRIIAMGFPAQGIEGLYRNSMKDVKNFLTTSHPNHYKIYNLCSERKYNHDHFQNRVAEYPFDDHNPPPFDLIIKICADITEWLDRDPANVAVLHCKAGKGRTGTIICCYLLHSCTCRTASQALTFFGEKRTHDGNGVTIPSQQRYITYFEQSLKPSASYVGSRTVYLNSIRVYNLPQKRDKYYVGIAVRPKRSFYAKPASRDTQGRENWMRFKLNGIPVNGDVKVELFYKNVKHRLFGVWINTEFIRKNKQRIVFHKSDLDHNDADNRLYPSNFRAIITFDMEAATDENGEKPSPKCPSCKLDIGKTLSIMFKDRCYHWECLTCEKCNASLVERGICVVQMTLNETGKLLCENCEEGFLKRCIGCNKPAHNDNAFDISGLGWICGSCFKCSKCDGILMHPSDPNFDPVFNDYAVVDGELICAAHKNPELLQQAYEEYVEAEALESAQESEEQPEQPQIVVESPPQPDLEDSSTTGFLIDEFDQVSAGLEQLQNDVMCMEVPESKTLQRANSAANHKASPPAEPVLKKVKSTSELQPPDEAGNGFNKTGVKSRSRSVLRMAEYRKEPGRRFVLLIKVDKREPVKMRVTVKTAEELKNAVLEKVQVSNVRSMKYYDRDFKSYLAIDQLAELPDAVIIQIQTKQSGSSWSNGNGNGDWQTSKPKKRGRFVSVHRRPSETPPPKPKPAPAPAPVPPRKEPTPPVEDKSVSKRSARCSVDKNASVIYCKLCKGAIIDQYFTVGSRDQTWHVKCFNCTDCGKFLEGERVAVTEAKGLQCRSCAKKPTIKCATCGEFIYGVHTEAVGKMYHPKCFVCTSCSKQLQGNFHLVGNEQLPHCLDCGPGAARGGRTVGDCLTCSKPVSDAGKYLEFGDKVVHSECFVCYQCKNKLDPSMFYIEGNKLRCANC